MPVTPGPDFRARLAAGPAARVVALPGRLALVARHDARVVGRSLRWLATSREHTNFTYELAAHNVDQLAWFVADVAGIEHADAARYVEEIRTDDELRDAIAGRLRSSERRGLTDPVPRYARRVGWYAFVRALRPELVVETGTDKGLGTLVLAAALRRNDSEGHGTGRVVTVDINPAAGSLICGPYDAYVERRTGDSLQVLADLGERVDLFLHDSDHSAAHEAAELLAIEPHLAPGALVLSDNAHVTNELSSWSEARGRRFLYFGEQPEAHWYPGAGIGASVPRSG